MNNSLPSLIDAIFGKEDLASVSLDEIYELINEFPSFNAGHFLLSKKLKQQNESAYEKETMRTALYFNNIFWLQSVLDEDNRPVQETIAFAHREEIVKEDEETEIYSNENLAVDTEVSESEINTAQVHSGFEEAENIPGTVTSFDELFSKYRVELPVTTDEFAAEPSDLNLSQKYPDSAGESFSQPANASGQEPRYEAAAPAVDGPPAESSLESDLNEEAELSGDFISGYEIRETEAEKPTTDTAENFEIREEIVNEYGIFEEVIVKKYDHDHGAFDRPREENKSYPESGSSEIVDPGIPASENETIVENQISEITGKPFDHDYDAFDRPAENPSYEENPTESEILPEIADTIPLPEADETENPIRNSGETEAPPDADMQHLSERYRQQQKSMATFDPKKAESIVFAPYHMIDYFASQGIKLVMEENPADQFGKQLKSFTDWLKVMKKLPAQHVPGKTDETEVDRIRHFAAHSIEERDILTESMAEVLAKQGMYENAIALYQKLSLIYPPKSAYFASRIEQLKASLP
jgi:hypothetical protein